MAASSIRAALLVLSAVAALRVSAADRPRAAGVTALVDDSVVPMDQDRAVPHQTVLVTHGRILAVGPAARMELLAGAVRIPGRGRFLMPGLYDLYAHVHEAALELFVANGVTTVRNTAPGLAAHLALRDAVARGEGPAPRILTTGPVVDGIAPSSTWSG